MGIIDKTEEIDEGNQRIFEIFGVQICHLDNLVYKIICLDLDPTWKSLSVRKISVRDIFTIYL